MEGADESTEPWWPPTPKKSQLKKAEMLTPKNIFPNEDKMQTEKNVPGVNRTKLPQNSNLNCTLARSNMVLLPSN